MTREEMIALLRGGPEGIRKFNAFRFEHLDFVPNLACADLRGVDLERASLELADLRSADLREVTAKRANFEKSDLRGARFGSAMLSGAVLDEAELAGTDFSGAKFMKYADWERCKRETERTITFSD